MKDVKDLLSPHLGVSRFRQRLLDVDLALMEDVIRLDIVPAKIQVITLAFHPCPTLTDQVHVLHAAETNDLATVQTMLSAALDPNTSCRGWEKPLHVALQHQHQSMIQLLLEAYADVTADSQPLMLATINGDIDITRLLVARGASVNAENPLAEAANRGHVDVVRYLLEAGADMNNYENGTDTPLLSAVIDRRPKVVDILLEAKVNVNLGNDEDFTPLMQAAGGDEPLLKALLDARADANRASQTGHTALLSAAFENDSEAGIKCSWKHALKSTCSMTSCKHLCTWRLKSKITA